MADKYTQSEVDDLGKKGQAFGPDDQGHYSYPIADADDLDNAIHAVGRGSADHDAIRKYIMGRADALGLSSKIPDNWNKDGSLDEAKSAPSADTECPTCDGSGTIMDGNRKCPDCGGTGVETKGLVDGTCNRCSGHKTVMLNGKDITCPQCGGSGTAEGNAEAKSRVASRISVRGEYLKVPEQRVSPHSPQFELREVPNGTGGTNLRFTGFASVTGENASYEMEDFLGPWTESITPGAFKKTLGDGADVAFLLNHTGMTLARTKPGTLKLSEETNPSMSPVPGVTGLHSEALLDPKNMYVQAMQSAVERGDLDEMSFAFRVMRQDWNADWDQRHINEVSLDKGDVSLVNYGANPHTGGTVALRQVLGVRSTADDRVMSMVARLGAGDIRAVGVALKRSYPLALADELREGKVLSAAIETMLTDALKALHAADDADLPGIVRALQDVNTALDAGQAGISAVLKVANPDGDPNDLQPALVPPEQKTLLRPSSIQVARLALAKAKAA